MGKTNKQITNKSVKESAAASRVKKRQAWLPPIKEEWVLFAGLALFLLTALFIVGDYGMNIDSYKNFREGEMNLNYLLTGQVNQRVLPWQIHGTYIFMGADLTKRLLHDTLHIYDPVAARHVILPFLSAIFLLFLFYFVKRHWNAMQGLITVGFLLSFPYFWGHSLSNLKDVPLLIFFSLSIMSFVEWVYTHKLRYLYGFFILWGFALAIKFYALLVPLVLFVWILIRPEYKIKNVKPPWHKSIAHILAGIVITMTIVLSLYMPAFWGSSEKTFLLLHWWSQVNGWVVKIDKPFNSISFVQIFFRTPFLILFLALTGLAWSAWHYRDKDLHTLLFIWLLVPVILPCFPCTAAYNNGMRLYLVFIVPWAVFASFGLFAVSQYLAEKIRIDRNILTSAFAVMTIGVSLMGIILTHPYETTFFNVLAGGLGGAQEKKIPDAGDYWLLSFMEAGRWINKNGAENAFVIALGLTDPGNFTPGIPGIPRRDLKVLFIPVLPVNIPSNTYVIASTNMRPNYEFNMLELSGNFERVHRITRQGGEICSVYYKP